MLWTINLYYKYDKLVVLFKGGTGTGWHFAGDCTMENVCLN